LFSYTGVEVAAGQWETSFTRGTLHLSASAAGLATFGYWGALTAVRIVLAVPRKLAEPFTVIRLGGPHRCRGCRGHLVAARHCRAGAGFVVLGGALAGVFPALVAVTPLRLGARRSPDVIAWQVGAAAAGGSAISALIGLLISASSLDVLGPALTVGGVVVVVANAALTRLAPGRRN
jgi:fucose permease